MIEGTKVVCLNGSIDRNERSGQGGVVAGFARLSSYHPREAMVRFDDGVSHWFWVRDLEPAQ